MAISYLSTIQGVSIVFCLSSDVKPTGNTNSVLFETDTGNQYKWSGGSWTASVGAGDLLASNNLSDVASASTARTNLGLNTTANQTDSADKRFMTDAQESKLDDITGTNTGDNATNTQYSSDYRAANFIAGTNYLDPSGNGSALTGLTKTQVGLSNVDNTSDVSKPVSTAQQTALDLKANLASPTFTGTPTLPTGTIATTQSAGNNTTAIATTAFVTAINNNSSYRTILDCSGSHIAAKVAGTYGMGQGDPLAVSGTGTLYPLKTIYIASADYPTINGITTKLRIRAQIYTNDVAPTGNYTFGLHPITRPATSGGAGVNIYTIGAVVAGSNGATFTTPAADGLHNAVGADFNIPADGHYIIAVVTTATVATSAHIHLSAQLQIRNA